ncbi:MULTISPECIES: AsnC family protein [unclassified Nonomuraea]|uniref:Lrp/AsnC family transcriptional regulator n=1 Tax=unclassified Nonomuraea TaxID=2593643 RepID=UPI003435E4B3
MGIDTADELDRRLIHALQLDARAPFSRIAEVLGVSDQTVARRYRRLRSAGLLRVVAVPPPDSTGTGAGCCACGAHREPPTPSPPRSPAAPTPRRAPGCRTATPTTCAC